MCLSSQPLRVVFSDYWYILLLPYFQQSKLKANFDWILPPQHCKFCKSTGNKVSCMKFTFVPGVIMLCVIEGHLRPFSASITMISVFHQQTRIKSNKLFCSKCMLLKKTGWIVISYLPLVQENCFKSVVIWVAWHLFSVQNRWKLPKGVLESSANIHVYEFCFTSTSVHYVFQMLLR